MKKHISMGLALVLSFGLMNDLNAQQDSGDLPAAFGDSGQQGRPSGKRGGQRSRKSQRPQTDGQGRSPASAEFLFKRFDSNQDGSISQSEAPDRMKERFGTIDVNSDGAVSQEELASALQSMGAQGGGRGGKGQGKEARGSGKGGPGGKGQARGERKGKAEGQGKGDNEGRQGKGQGRGQADRGGQGFDASSLIERVDQNGDGVISLEEAPERMKGRFDQVDTDGSGTVTAEELSSALQGMQRGGRGKGRSGDGDAGGKKGGVRGGKRSQ